MDFDSYNAAIYSICRHLYEDDTLSYDKKLELLNIAKMSLKKLDQDIRKQRISEGKCPHEELMDASTFIDRANGIQKKMCVACRETLIYRGGILEDANDEN